MSPEREAYRTTWRKKIAALIARQVLPEPAPRLDVSVVEAPVATESELDV